MRPSRKRADLLLVSRGRFDSRTRAREAIEAGLVRADGKVVTKPSELLPEDADLVADDPHPWVSRGGLKLSAALDSFGIDPAGLVCLDIGASTGGFTEVLLSRGAAHVTAVDVGHAQLHPRVAADRRVVSLEGTDARALDGVVAAGSVDLATIDVSFISLRLVLPAISVTLRSGGRIVALVKPQFEVGREGLGRGGIVRDPARRTGSVAAVSDTLAGLGFRIDGLIESPIAGGDGNIEFLLGSTRV